MASMETNFWKANRGTVDTMQDKDEGRANKSRSFVE